MDAEELAARLGVFRKILGADVEGARREGLLDRDIDAADPCLVHAYVGDEITAAIGDRDIHRLPQFLRLPLRRSNDPPGIFQCDHNNLLQMGRRRAPRFVFQQLRYPTFLQCGYRGIAEACALITAVAFDEGHGGVLLGPAVVQRSLSLESGSHEDLYVRCRSHRWLSRGRACACRQRCLRHRAWRSPRGDPRNGLRLRIDGEEKTARIPTSEEPGDFGPQDAVICAIEAHQSWSECERFAPLLGPDTSVVTAANGIPWWYFYKTGGRLEGHYLESVDLSGRQWKAIGPERAIGCVVDPACEVVSPGLIVHHEFKRFTIGEPDGSVSTRVRALAHTLTTAGFDAPVRDNIRWNVWLKRVPLERKASRLRPQRSTFRRPCVQTPTCPDISSRTGCYSNTFL